MPFGADDVLSVVGFSLTCFHGCVKGLTILSKANHYNQDVSNVRLQIELAQHSLFTWAEEAGLTQEPPTLLISTNNAAFVPEILGQLETLLLDLNQLKERYGLRLQLTSENVEALDDEDSTLSKLGPKQREYASRADVAIFRKRKDPWKRLRWVTLDDKKVAKLLDKVKGYTGELEKFLEQTKQAKRDRDLELSLREAVLNANDQQKLDIIGHEYEQAPSKAAIAAAARLKQTRLRLGLSDLSPLVTSANPESDQGEPTSGKRPNIHHASTSHLSGVSSNAMKLSMRLLTLSRVARAQGLRTLTHYDNRAVLLEWKNGMGPDSAVLERRVNQVAAFLQKLEPSFHSLPCRGFVKDHDANRYGYIFDLPEKLHPISLSVRSSQGQAALPPLPDLRSLRQLLDQSATAPSLNERLSISVTLLETLLNLHTSGWLHKELRSDNIIFIRKAETVGDDKEDLSMYSMYIAGYVYARADGPGEMTEPLESDVEADLYRHPLLLGKSRESYRKSFDIFSAGCTLLEIGLWSSLRRIFERHSARVLPSGRQIRQPLLKSSTFSSTSTGSTLVDRHEGKRSDDKNDDDTKPSLDLMRLKHELLLSYLTEQKASSTRTKTQETSRDQCMIMQSLEAATGNLYASVVEELLSVGGTSWTGKDANVNEHEYALDLEIRARDAVQAIANAI